VQHYLLVLEASLSRHLLLLMKHFPDIDSINVLKKYIEKQILQLFSFQPITNRGYKQLFIKKP